MKPRAWTMTGWLLALVLAQCGTLGSDPHAGQHSSTPTDNAYRVWYAAPPWELVEQTTDHTVLHIPTAVNSAVPSGLAGSTIGLDIDVTAGTPESAVTTAQGLGVGRGAMVIVPLRPVTFAAGVMGVESSWTDGVIVERVAAARLADGRTAILDFQSVDSIQNDDDVTAMIGQFETAPMASH